MGEPEGPVEVEVKARVADLERLRSQLLDRGAQPLEERREADTYFEHPSRSLAQTDEALRVRETADRAFLTYKGPRVDEATKTRGEIDLAVEDAERARALVEALGFTPAGTVVKDREVLDADGLTVTLDRVEGLGTFVEIEQVVEDDVDEARREVLALADELGLGDRERRSYLELILSQEGAEGGAT